MKKIIVFSVFAFIVLSLQSQCSLESLGPNEFENPVLNRIQGGDNYFGPPFDLTIGENNTPILSYMSFGTLGLTEWANSTAPITVKFENEHWLPLRSDLSDINILPRWADHNIQTSNTVVQNSAGEVFSLQGSTYSPIFQKFNGNEWEELTSLEELLYGNFDCIRSCKGLNNDIYVAALMVNTIVVLKHDGLNFSVILDFNSTTQLNRELDLKMNTAGDLFLSYAEMFHNFKVKKYTGSNWIDLPNYYNSNPNNLGYTSRMSINNLGEPVVATQVGGEIRVLEYCSQPNSWKLLGNSIPDAVNSFSMADIECTSDHNYHLVYRSSLGALKHLQLSADNVWQNGVSLSNPTAIQPGTDYSYFEFEHGTNNSLYLAISEEVGSIEVYSLENNTWQRLGGEGIAEGKISDTKLIRNHNNELVVIFKDMEYDNKLSAMIYRDGEWRWYGSRGFTNEPASLFDATTDAATHSIYIAYLSALSESFSVMKFENEQWSLSTTNLSLEDDFTYWSSVIFNPVDPATTSIDYLGYGFTYFNIAASDGSIYLNFGTFFSRCTLNFIEDPVISECLTQRVSGNIRKWDGTSWITLPNFVDNSTSIQIQSENASSTLSALTFDSGGNLLAILPNPENNGVLTSLKFTGTSWEVHDQDFGTGGASLCKIKRNLLYEQLLSDGNTIYRLTSDGWQVTSTASNLDFDYTSNGDLYTIDQRGLISFNGELVSTKSIGEKAWPYVLLSTDTLNRCIVWYHSGPFEFGSYAYCKAFNFVPPAITVSGLPGNCCSFPLFAEQPICLPESTVLHAPVGYQAWWYDCDNTTASIGSYCWPNYQVGEYNPQYHTTTYATNNDCIEPGFNYQLRYVLYGEICTVLGRYSIEHLEIPPVNILMEPTILCPGSEIVLTTEHASLGTWSTGQVDSNISVSDPGIYTVQVANGFCTATDSVDITLQSTTPISLSNSGELNVCAGEEIQLESNSTNPVIWNNGSTSESLFLESSGLYFCSAIDPNGCEVFSDTLYYSVNEIPSVEIQQGDLLSLCNQTTAPLSVANNQIASWSNGSIGNSIDVSNTSWYYATIINEWNCEATDSIFVDATVLTPSISSQLEVVPFFLEASPLNADYEYQWINCSSNTIVATVPMLQNPAIGQSYAVQITYGNCIQESECFSVTSVNRLNTESFSITPNPASEIVVIGLPNNQHSHFRILNSNGQTVITGKFNGTKEILNISHLSSGLYLLDVEGNREMNTRFVKL